MSAAIEFRNVGFATAEGRLLLDGVSLAVEEGTTTAVLGRSGAGKTTLLRTVNRMVEPTSGEVLVGGRSVRDADLIALRRSIGYVIQETGLFPHMTAERNVALVLEAEGRPRAGAGAAQSANCCTRWGWSRTSLRGGIRISSRVGSGSGWDWRGRWRRSRACC